MHQVNSSTSSSEPVQPGQSSRSGATAASLAATLCWTILWLAGMEAACQRLIRVEAIRETPVGRPLAAYLERGESTVRRLRSAWVSDDPNVQAMIDAGWIDRARWRALPAQRTAATPHLAAFYGNSFTRQIATEVGRLDPAVGIRMIFGPVAPASHAYACFLEDRAEHDADAVVMGVVLEMLPGLYSMTRSTVSVVEPSPYTFPRYWLENGVLESAEPPVRRFEEFGRALADPELWAAHLSALERHDAFYSAAIYDESWLDELTLARMLKSAWAIGRHRAIEGPVLAGLAEPESSEAVALLVELLRRFGEQARADGRRPLVLLIDTPTVSSGASRYVRDQLARGTSRPRHRRDLRRIAAAATSRGLCGPVAEKVGWIEAP
ncbi:MAG: hypothetical protein IPK00_02290 [Deltaproteobacteria bacterium]|nr:hypothetical protein [Deltaproteobacteria bacterium]